MNDKIIQWVTIGIVAAAFYYWLQSSRNLALEKSANPHCYSPLLGDVRQTRGRGTNACSDDISGNLVSPGNTPIALASDYLDCRPAYAPATSNINLAESQNQCESLDPVVHYDCMSSTDPFGLSGQSTIPVPVCFTQTPSCNPDVPLQADCCLEVV